MNVFRRGLLTRARSQYSFTARRHSSSTSVAVRLRDLQTTLLPQLAAALNLATGYDAVVERKQRVEAKDGELKAAMRALDAAKAAYEESIDERRRCQKEVNSLLQRKDSWVDEDIHRFTVLYRKDLTLEAAEAATKQAYKQSSDAYEVIHQEYLNQIRERYIDEQLFSDKIRSASTWWTVGLISAHLCIFLLVSIRDPWVKKRDRVELVALVQDILQTENASLEKSIKEIVSIENSSTSIAPANTVFNGSISLQGIAKDPGTFLFGIGVGAAVTVLSAFVLY